jgi:hypothetical protein
MSSTCFESWGSSSRRQFDIQLWYGIVRYGTFYMHQYKQSSMYIYNRLPEDEPSDSKHVKAKN